MDALILAGTGKGYLPVATGNKALIEIMGRPIIEYVIDALRSAEHVGSIYVVGPLTELSFLAQRHQDVEFFQQGDSLVDNVLSSYEKICPELDRHILVTASDIPFVRPQEVDGFISSSAFRDYDVVLGVSNETALRRFYPSGGETGLKPACCYFRQGPIRLNNLFIMKYPTETLREYAGLLYSLRYQKRLMNFARLMLQVARKDPDRLRLIWTLIIMQVTLQADRMGLPVLARAIGKLLDIRKAEDTVSGTISARFRAVIMDYGGSVMDIDNEASLEAAQAMFHRFMSLADEPPSE